MIRPQNSLTFQFLPEVLSGENPEVVPCSRREFTEICLCSPRRHVGISATRIPSQQSLPFARSLCRGDDTAWWSTDGAVRLPSCQSHAPARCAASLCLPPRCALCAASLLPPLRQLCPTSPLPLLAAPQNWSGSVALKYQWGTGMLVSLISAAGLTGKQNGGVWWERESTEGVGGGLTPSVRGWRKIRQQKGRICGRWGRSRTAVVGRNGSMNKNSFANWAGGGGWNPTGNGISGFVARVRGITTGDFLWNGKTDLLKTKQGKLGSTAISQSSSFPYRSVSKGYFILGNISSIKPESSKIATLALPRQWNFL